MMTYHDLRKHVVDRSFCCGCGVCSGICPVSCIEMRFNKCGEYSPELNGKCTECGLCTKVCPFYQGNPSEDVIASQLFKSIEGINYDPRAGYYIESYAANAPDSRMRWDGASGGAATFLLCQLLEKNMIDAVLTVAPNKDPKKLFKYSVASTEDEIRKSSKSAYYPVEVSEVLKHIIENEGRYAIVGLPCVCKAIRLAQQNNKVLKERIVFLVGLVCGQQKSSMYTKHISKLAGLSDDPTSVCFRVKKEGESTDNYFFSAVSSGKTVEMGWHDGASGVWLSNMYALPSCFYCDDIFAECADVTFMDAWLKQYMPDSKGTSLIIVRRNDLIKMLRPHFEEIDINLVVESQKGQVLKKRRYLELLLKTRKVFGVSVPEKRVKPVWRIPRTGEAHYLLLTSIASIRRRNIIRHNKGWRCIEGVQLFPFKAGLAFVNLVQRIRSLF